MSRIITPCLVQLALPSRVELNAYLVLDDKPTRQNLKLKTLKKYVQQHPQGWKKRLELAELLYEMSDWEQAVEEYRQVLERQPQLTEVSLQLGRILYLLGKVAEAVEVYERALSLSQNLATKKHLAGLIAISRCLRTGLAIAEFKSATSLEPDNAAHWLALALTHLSEEAPIAALLAFERVLELNQYEIVALTHSYDTLIAVGHYQKAQQRVRQVLELVPNDVQALNRLAVYRSSLRLVWGEAGRETRGIIRKSAQLAPHVADVQKSLAYYHIYRGEREKGIAVMHQFVEQHPNYPSGWYYYAQCLFHTGDFLAAAEAILKAYMLYQKDCEIYRAACEILPHAGKLQELYPLLQEMLDYFKQRWSVWVSVGRVLVEKFQDTGGSTVSAKGLQLQPDLADCWFRHGRVLALAGNHQQAVAALEQGWQRLPEHGAYWQSVPAAAWLAKSYQALGMSASSQEWWTEAGNRAHKLMDIDPAMANYWRGRSLEALGDVPGAIQVYQTALSYHLLYPIHQEVEAALKRLSNSKNSQITTGDRL